MADGGTRGAAPGPSSGEPAWPTRRRIAWSAATACAALAVGLLWAAAIGREGGIPVRGDLLQDWASARNHLEGSPLYADLAQSVLRHTGERYRGLPVNAHPPASILVVLPLANLDYRTAFLVWNGVWLAVLPLLLVWICRQPGVAGSPWLALPVLCLLLPSRPLEEEMAQGQFNLLLLALLTGAWVAERRGRQALAGACVGVAAAIKLFPAFVALYFVARRQWGAVVAVLLAFSALNGLSLVCFGPEAFASFFAEALGRASLYDESWRNFSVRGWFHKLFDPDRFAVAWVRAPGVARWAPPLVALAVAAISARIAAAARTRAQSDVAYATILIALLLATPIVWEHYWLLLTLPLILLGTARGDRTTSRALLVALALVLALPRPSLLADASPRVLGEFASVAGRRAAQPIHSLTVLAYPLYAVVALFVLSCRTAVAGRSR